MGNRICLSCASCPHHEQDLHKKTILLAIQSSIPDQVENLSDKENGPQKKLRLGYHKYYEVKEPNHDDE